MFHRARSGLLCSCYAYEVAHFDKHICQNGKVVWMSDIDILSSILLPDDIDRLKRFVSFSIKHNIESTLRSSLLSHHTGVHLTKAEVNAWIDVYVAWFSAANEIVALSDGYTTSDHTSVYEAWKEMTNALIRGYSTGQFQAWTIPCLYVAGRYLRIFAIKADQHARSGQPVAYGSGLSDDITSSISKNEKLEDAARVINRIFQLCISDRYMVVSIVQIKC